jgi:SAM-dependent methyltransferase
VDRSGDLGEVRTSESQGCSERGTAKLLESWDPMFANTIDPTRPQRMDAIVAILGESLQEPFTVLDLGSGPGTLVARILQRFQGATVVALDTDPVLLRVGREALHHFEARASWVLADLREPDWPSALPFPRFDAVISSLALHWLEKDEIRRTYRGAREVLRPHGVMINADYLPRTQDGSSGDHGRGHDGTSPVGVRTADGLQAFKSEWATWWGLVRADRSMGAALRERSVRMPGSIPPRRTTGPDRSAPLAFHARAMRAAGLRDVGVRWEDGDFRALVGRR